MSGFEPRDPDFERRVRASFARQTFMTTIGARIVAVAPGAVEIGLGHSGHLLQQHGFVHAGAIVAAVDSAAGSAAMSLMPADAGVVTAEQKINMLNPCPRRPLSRPWPRPEAGPHADGGRGPPARHHPAREVSVT